MSRFPGHYPTSTSSPALSTRSYRTVSNLINMSEVLGGHSDQEFDNADVPFSATLVTSPNSPYGMPLKEEDSDDEGPQIIEEPPRSPTPPSYQHHPTYYYEDGTVFIAMEGYLFRIHHYLFLPDDGNIINEFLRERGCDAVQPFILPEAVKIGSFEHILEILYRHPLDSTTIPIKLLKDACLTANALNMVKICDFIANHIIANDSPDEPLEEAVPKYVLSIKLPHRFPRAFKEAQIDKMCWSTAAMTHSHFFELGFHELNKIWKGVLAARAGYDGQTTQIYEPPPVPPRTSFLIKVKNMAGYRAAKREIFG